MPCDTVQRSTVNLSVADVDVLQAALEADGHRVVRLSKHRLAWSQGYGQQFNYDAQRKQLTAPDGVDVNEIKRSYSRQVVRKVSGRFGWTLTQQNATTFTAKKRRF